MTNIKFSNTISLTKMKNFVIIFLIVVISVLSSFLYKNSKTPIYKGFPVEKITANENEVPFVLYIFFSKKNCKDCLEVIHVLNELSPPFMVFGVVPGSELKDESKLRKITGAVFPIISNRGYKKYIPPYSPSIVGMSKDGKIYFVFPGIPGMNEFLKNFIFVFYQKIYGILHG